MRYRKWAEGESWCHVINIVLRLHSDHIPARDRNNITNQVGRETGTRDGCSGLATEG
jgi:hypothetical protein